MNQRRLIFIMVSLILLIGLNTWIMRQQSHFSAKNQYINQMAQLQRPTQQVTSSQSYIERGPITITSNSQLNNSAVTGFKGNGTIDDPILIEWYNITASSGTLISISSTTFYFRIANCLLNGLTTNSQGIRLFNVHNGFVSNNIIFNSGGTGIRLLASQEINIDNNKVYNNSGDGIGLWQTSKNINISNNEVYNNKDTGILLGDNEIKNIIVNNTIYNNCRENGNGISLYNSNDNLIDNNTAYSNGIWHTGPYSDGIRLTSSHNNTLSHNTVYDNAQAGINILHSSNNTITDNTAFKNSENGVNIVDSNSSTTKPVANNFAFENGWSGIGLGNSENYSIVNNTAYNNNQDGITMIDYGGGSSHNVTFTRNILYDNNDHGIRLGVSTENYISHNLIYINDKYGINLELGFDNNKIEMNDLSANNAGGGQAYDDGSNNVFRNNYWSDWIGSGAYYIDGSADNEDLSPLTDPYHLSVPVITAPTSDTSTLKESVTIQWIASSDTFDHSLTYNVYYSNNSGSTWKELASGLTSTSYTWDLSSIFNGTQVILKVEAVDSVGFRSYSVISTSFTIDNPLLTSAPSKTKGVSGWGIPLLILSLIVLLPFVRKKKNL
ncbi:MAG: right-handed parallel beta-helix repeat-containing protein [Candidatus Hodarchaeota archaeon]